MNRVVSVGEIVTLPEPDFSYLDQRSEVVIDLTPRRYREPELEVRVSRGYVAPRTPEPPRDDQKYIEKAAAKRARRNAKRAALLQR
jgi:hypothetical protein